MSWVEELKPEDEVKVEIIWPKLYADYNILTMKKYTGGIAHLCRAAAILEEDETEFLIWGITALQTQEIENLFVKYGVELTHEHGKLPDGTRWTYFYADVRGLRKLLENGGDLDGIK